MTIFLPALKSQVSTIKEGFAFICLFLIAYLVLLCQLILQGCQKIWHDITMPFQRIIFLIPQINVLRNDTVGILGDTSRYFLATVPAPLTDAVTIKEFWFWAPDYHIKNAQKCVLAWKVRGLATNWERLLMTRVRYLSDHEFIANKKWLSTIKISLKSKPDSLLSSFHHRLKSTSVLSWFKFFKLFKQWQEMKIHLVYSHGLINFGFFKESWNISDL